MSEPWTVLIPSLITSLVALGVAILTYRSNRIDINRQEKADAMTAYSTLLDDMRAMVDLNNQELARLRQEYQDLKCRLDIERAAWEAERQVLRQRITELERINQRLELKIVELQAQIQREE